MCFASDDQKTSLQRSQRTMLAPPCALTRSVVATNSTSTVIRNSATRSTSSGPVTTRASSVNERAGPCDPRPFEGRRILARIGHILRCPSVSSSTAASPGLRLAVDGRSGLVSAEPVPFGVVVSGHFACLTTAAVGLGGAGGTSHPALRCRPSFRSGPSRPSRCASRRSCRSSFPIRVAWTDGLVLRTLPLPIRGRCAPRDDSSVDYATPAHDNDECRVGYAWRHPSAERAHGLLELRHRERGRAEVLQGMCRPARARVPACATRPMPRTRSSAASAPRP